MCVQSGSRALGSMAPTCSDQQAGLLSAEVKALTKFVTQLEYLSILSLLYLYHRFRHRNIVDLMGYSQRPPALVFEFMENGSLFHHLHSKVCLLKLCITFAVSVYRMCVLSHGKNVAKF